MTSLKTSLPAIICSLLSLSLLAQEQFERRYATPAETFITTSMAQKGSGYLLLSIEVDDEGLWPQLNLTDFDSKGDINWSNNILLGDTAYIREIGEVVNTPSGLIALSAVLQKDSLNKAIVLVDADGNHIWTRIMGQDQDLNAQPPGRSNLVSLNDRYLIHTNRTTGDNDQEILISSYTYDGEPLYSSRMSASDSENNEIGVRVRDAIQLVDSTLLLVGNTTSASNQLFLAKMDTLGRVLWSRSYTGEFSSVLDETVMAVTQLPDSSIVMFGAQAGGTTTPFVLHLNDDGTYRDARTISPTNSMYEFFPNSIVGLDNEQIGLSFKRLNTQTAEVHPVVMKYDLDSTTEYRTLLKVSSDLIIDRSGLITNDSLSLAFASSTYDEDSLRYVPYLVKLDESGETFCSEDHIDFSYDSVFFLVDTLVWNIDALTKSDSFETTVSVYSGFNPPILNLNDTIYCPQDPIMHIVDATVEGGVSYLWDDGNVDSIRLFLEEGMFSVTVTVAGDICYTLCDTVTISVKEEPMAEILVNPANFCTDGTLQLLVQSNNPIESVSWSTGENTPLITISELTTYNVTIVDDCGLPAEASINLSDFSIARNPTLGILQDNLCVDNTLILIVTNTNELDPANFIWSNGESGVSFITIDQPGEYTVENLEQFCPGEATVILDQNQFVPDLTVDILDNCTDPIQLFLQGTGIVSQEWFDGSTNATATVTEAGTYTVTVTDVCGETLEGSITISEDRIRECINPPTGEKCLEWPNTFIPESNEPVNTTFGPYTENCGIVENYELKIYNRWGKNIFTSNSVDVRWDGTDGGNQAPGGVYFYHASYSDSVDTFQDEGDITLIR